MCHRIMPLRMDTLVQAMERQKQTGHATVQFSGQEAVEAYPGMRVPLLLPDKTGALQVASLTWGLKPQSRGTSPISGLVFNTRLDTALDQMQKGYGMWHEAIRFGRCLVPVRWFYETSRSHRTISARTGKPVFAQYRFRVPGRQVFLLGGVVRGITSLWSRPSPMRLSLQCTRACRWCLARGSRSSGSVLISRVSRIVAASGLLSKRPNAKLMAFLACCMKAASCRACICRVST